MTTVTISKFHNGMADDYIRGVEGEFSVSKHFDILSYPDRLQPLRGMTAESVTDSKIGNIIVASNGLMYGVGTDPSNPTQGQLWYRSGYGASDVWAALSSAQLSGAVLRSGDYKFLVSYPETTGTRTVFWASTNKIMFSDPAGASSAESGALTFSTISQGFVHPKDKILYFGYQTSTATYIAKHDGSLGTPFNPSGTLNASSWNTTAFTLSSKYRVVGLCDWGNYLAIGCTMASASGYTGATDKISVIFLWDRDTSNTLPNEVINWGSGALKILNNLDGILVGIGTMSAGYTGSIQDADSIILRAFSGGTDVQQIREFKATRLTSTAPSCAINENVNFVYRNRLYFSANIINGGTAPAYYGLWSVGKNKNGRFVVTIERMATNDGSETGVLAAAISGDFVSMAHTAVGTLTYTINGNSLSAIYAGTSVYESCINPEMNETDYEKDKKFIGVWATYLPLPDDATIVMQYRVDSSANGSWTTIFTETGNGVTFTERTSASGTNFTDGRKYEFRLTSVGGGIITDWGYNYQTKTSII